MANCIKCGGMLDEFDAGGDMICQNCESAASGAQGGGSTAPCQRCGMYLPSHELRMWNSRLYCAYCIMDVQDDEKRSKAAGEGRGVGGEGGGKVPRICERCGRETDVLYTVQGRKMCTSCYSVGSGAGGGAPSALGLLVENVAIALGVRQKPKVVPSLPQEKIGIRMQSGGQDDRERQRKSQERFNLKERRMMEEEEGQLGIEKPLSEGAHKEKKPSPEARKSFFSKLGGEKK